jgi:hypothetical protein
MDQMTFSYKGIDSMTHFLSISEEPQDGMSKNFILNINPSKFIEADVGVHEFQVIADDGLGTATFPLSIEVTIPEESTFSGIVIEEVDE